MNQLIFRAIGVILLIITFPLFLLISFLIFLIDGLPVFYFDKRMGIQFKPFFLIKFRTMHQNNGSLITSNDDKRISRLGNILRKLKLDEIPQLINIIKGEMSFVGPRPESYEIAEKYPHYYNYLNTTRPGVTDISSILFKNESELIKSNDNEIFYKNILMPVKSMLAFLFVNNESNILRFNIIILTLLSFINYKLSVYLINKLILKNSEIEIRKELNMIFNTDKF